MMRVATSEQIFGLQGARAPHSLRTALELAFVLPLAFKTPMTW